MPFGTDLSAWKATPFVDSHEIQDAFNNPLYPQSEAFRQAVAVKLSITPDNLGGQAHVGLKSNAINVATPGSHTIHELAPEDATHFSTVATPEELQQYADLHFNDPLALDYKSLNITPREPKPEPAPTPPSFDEEQVRLYGKTLAQRIAETNERDERARQQKEQRMQDLRDERAALLDERDRINQELGLL